MWKLWTPLIYQYAIGLLIFLAGIVIALRTRACDPANSTDRRWLKIATLGLAAFFTLHLSLYLLAIYVCPTVIQPNP